MTNRKRKRIRRDQNRLRRLQRVAPHRVRPASSAEVALRRMPLRLLRGPARRRWRRFVVRCERVGQLLEREASRVHDMLETILAAVTLARGSWGGAR